MSQLKRPFQFGKLLLPSNVFYSPLAGCSDFPFRQMVAPYNPGLQYCEMVKTDALLRNDKNTFHMLDFDTEMHPIGAQLCGSDPKMAAQAAKIVEDLGFDVIDLNCGCPVDKVTKDGSGSGMLKRPELIGEMISEMVNAVSMPVTVKIRAGWDEEMINAVEITKIAEQAGALAIAVHGRTRQQGYKGPANWEWIRACKEAAKEILVIGNGDVFDGPAAQRMFDETGCDIVLASRGTMGNPWLCQDIYDYCETGLVPQRTATDYIETLITHFRLIQAYRPSRRAVLDFRRVGCWYAKQSPQVKGLRESISKVRTLDDISELINQWQSREKDLGERIRTSDLLHPMQVR